MALKRSLRCGNWAQSPPRGLGRDLSTLPDTRLPCFNVEKHPEAGSKRALPPDISGALPLRPAVLFFLASPPDPSLGPGPSSFIVVVCVVDLFYTES